MVWLKFRKGLSLVPVLENTLRARGRARSRESREGSVEVIQAGQMRVSQVRLPFYR